MAMPSANKTSNGKGGFRGRLRGPPPPPPLFCGLLNILFNMESRHLLNLSVQNVLDCTSENFNLENFPAGACARNSIEKCIVRSPDGRYRARIRAL